MFLAPLFRTQLYGNVPLGRFVLLFIGVCLAIGAGCTPIRIPKIDPTGQCLFAPYPENSTEFSIPGLNGEPCGCLSGGRPGNPGLLSGICPEPAFIAPAVPPPCITGNLPGNPSAPLPGPTLPPGCQTCADGPPAVLFGNQRNRRDCLRSPLKGKRGCILLTPQRVIAPVGGEVVLKSGICGPDGLLQVGEPLEWMLTPESVGHIIQVGDDNPGLLHRLTKTPKADKRSGAFARGVTSTKPMLITRGNKNLRDDVQLNKGQTWVSLSSPTEGTSRITVLAPESDCWDQRKATTTIYWIDARWQFPGNQVLAAGNPATLSTHVTRSEGQIPARGWKVRYEILNPELAKFYDGTTVNEVVVNESGDASVQILPVPNTSGTATVAATVVRPAGETENMPRMVIGQGQIMVTWSSAKLQLRVAAPNVASFDRSFPLSAIVSNPGDLPAEKVRVIVEIPPGVTAETNDAFGRIVGNQILWEIPRLDPQTQISLQAELAAKAPFDLRFEARAAPNLFHSVITSVNIFKPSLDIQVQSQSDPSNRPQVGQDVRFNIDVTNTGDEPITGLRLTATGDESMSHLQGGKRQVSQTKDVLQPGETWHPGITFIPEAPGQRCVSVEVTGDRGQQAEASDCVTVINRIPETPSLSAQVESAAEWTVGSKPLFRYRAINTGRVPLTNVQMNVVFDPQLSPLEATDGVDESFVDQGKLVWVIPRIEPGQSQTVEGTFNAIAPNQRALMILTVSSDQGAKADDSWTYKILPADLSGTPLGPDTSQPKSNGPDWGTQNGIPDNQSVSPTEETPRIGTPRNSATTERLYLTVSTLDNPVRVDDPIRLTLTIKNDRAESDSQVQIRFALPPGVSVLSSSQTRNPNQRGYTTVGGKILFPEIRELRPGEAISIDLVLRSNQPQTMDLIFEASSRLHSGQDQLTVVEKVRVIPR